MEFSKALSWKLLNPLFGDVYPQSQEGSTAIDWCQADIVWLSSPTLTFVREGHSDQALQSEATGQLDEVLGVFLRKLRHISGLAEMPKGGDLAWKAHQEIDRLPELNQFEAVSLGAKVKSSCLTARATLSDVEAAAALPDDFTPPIYTFLLLDAIAALQSRDHMMAILLAAMAMEVAFGTTLDVAYADVVQKPLDSRFRVIKIPGAGGNSSTKDPIYDRLRERTDFSVRMHEMSLYVLGRSLRHDKEGLYKRALILYRSRNKIVHLGTTDDAKEEVIPVDGAGAYNAIETADAVLTWLGVNPGIKLPEAHFLSGVELEKFIESLKV